MPCARCSARRSRSLTVMANEVVKTEHAGAKNGGGYWGYRADAKAMSNRTRRAADKAEAARQRDDE